MIMAIIHHIEGIQAVDHHIDRLTDRRIGLHIIHHGHPGRLQGHQDHRDRQVLQDLHVHRDHMEIIMEDHRTDSSKGNGNIKINIRDCLKRRSFMF